MQQSDPNNFKLSLIAETDARVVYPPQYALMGTRIYFLTFNFAYTWNRIIRVQSPTLSVNIVYTAIPNNHFVSFNFKSIYYIIRVTILRSRFSKHALSKHVRNYVVDDIYPKPVKFGKHKKLIKFSTILSNANAHF